MAFFLNTVWKLIQVGYPAWMVYIIRDAQLSSRGTEESHEEGDKKEHK